MKSVTIALVMTATMLALTGSSEATKFDPLFRVTSVQGECTVMPKGDKAFVPVESGKAYHYGSQIKTGRKSSLIVLLADGNECQVLANAELVMAQDVKNAKMKIIKLKAGRVDIDLDPEFENSGYGLQVETAAAICGAIGTKGTVDVRSDKEMSVTTCGVKEGKFYAKGPQFMIPELDVDDLISIATSVDREFTRIKNLKGSYNINCKNSAGEPQTMEVKLNAVVKIWQRRTDIGNNLTVTIIFTSANGKVEQAFTYTLRDERTPSELAHQRNEIREDIKEALKKLDESDTVVTTTTTTTTTVTTSTTIPDGVAITTPSGTTVVVPVGTTVAPTAPNVTPSGRR